MMAIRRGAFQPYFGKQGETIPHFPREPKREVLQDFSERVGIGQSETKPEMGLF